MLVVAAFRLPFLHPERVGDLADLALGLASMTHLVLLVPLRSTRNDGTPKRVPRLPLNLPRQYGARMSPLEAGDGSFDRGRLYSAAAAGAGAVICSKQSSVRAE